MHNLVIQEFESALNSIWETIALDVLEMCEDKIASKQLVIEMCLDADRMASMGELKADALLQWNGLSHSNKLKIANTAFIHSNYGY